MTKIRLHTQYENNTVNPPVQVDVVEYVDVKPTETLQQVLDRVPGGVRAGNNVCVLRRIIAEELQGDEAQEGI